MDGPDRRCNIVDAKLTAWPSRMTGQRSTESGTSSDSKSSISVCKTSGAKVSSTSCHSLCVGWRMTATRRTRFGRY
jgi:hypothetical protein